MKTYIVPGIKTGHAREMAVKFKVGDKDSIWMIDTGASISLVKPGVSSSPVNVCRIAAKSVTGQFLKIQGAQQVHFHRGINFRVDHECLVCSIDIAYDGILGLDFLRKVSASLNMATNTLTVMGEHMKLVEDDTSGDSNHEELGLGLITSRKNSAIGPYQESQYVGDQAQQTSQPTSQTSQPGVRSSSSTSPKPESEMWQVFNHARFRLPARCETILEGKLKTSAKNITKEAVVVEPTKVNIHGVHVSRMVGYFKDRSIHVKLINLSNEEIEIPRNTLLGEAHKAGEVIGSSYTETRPATEFAKLSENVHCICHEGRECKEPAHAAEAVSRQQTESVVNSINANTAQMNNVSKIDL